ncbi:ATP-dependent DNA helicase RecG [Peptococcaceae bacterium]|nr:ATP-dependent DNA helicase RecG [Peptococcaceae bacterium]
MESIFDKPVQFVKGVGHKKAENLKKIEIFTLFDLLYHFPKDYLNRSSVIPAYASMHGQLVTVSGRVVGIQELKPRKNLSIIKIAVRDHYSVFFAVWFNQKHVLKQYKVGDRLLITGKVDKSYRNTVQVNVVECELIDEDEDKNLLLPIYSLTEGITQRQMRVIMQNALYSVQDIKEFIPKELLDKYKLPALYDALKNIHFPEDLESAKKTRRRFIFEEFFLLQLALVKRRKNLKEVKKLHSYQNAKSSRLKFFLECLPFKPTADQNRVWEEIQRDMNSTKPMNRLLQGDVGSGKTLLSALMLLKAVDAGLQGAFMVPTEILAEQHYINLSKWFEGLKVKLELLTSRISKSQRTDILHKLKSGQIDVLIGTHALLTEDVVFKNLACVVIDEQHRFGVKQRLNLLKKGAYPDVLIMTATPIPRTLALTAYGDLDISVINNLPPGRKPVRTYHITKDSIDKLYRLIKKEALNGRQSYIVCPLIEESEALEAEAATKLADELIEMSRDKSSILYGLRIGLLHGKLKVGEKENVMEMFRKGGIDVLVSTTVIEVGVDVPNATVMAIIDAERFGLAQLHQLRGRVGRGTSQSYCILVCDPKSKESRMRINAFVNTSDGFELAEQDLRLRGPGEFLGTKQSGIPKFKIADIIRDQKALIVAKKEAELMLENKGALSNKILLQELKRRFKTGLSFVN